MSKEPGAVHLHLLPKGALRDVVRYFIPMSKSEETRECEQPLEMAVSQVIGEMPFLWLAVGDKKGPASLHGYPAHGSVIIATERSTSILNYPGFPTWLSQDGDDGNRMRFPRRLRQ